MIKAVFVDFYGTVVHEDGAVIEKISDIIGRTGTASDRKDINSFWWDEFRSSFMSSYGSTFRSQRDLEYDSLRKTIEHFNSTADAEELSNMMFEHWRRPPIFPDTKAFFEDSPLPVHIVSNIDRDDIEAAIEYHGLLPAGVFTSEDIRSYKPRRDIFDLALDVAGYEPSEVIHVGDSLSGDVRGASDAGIRPLWLNRDGRDVPDGVESISVLTDVFRFI